MWLRRLGVPHLWPSRAKVSLMCLLQVGFIYSFTSYLRRADVDYLDLTTPQTEEVFCGLPEPTCADARDPLACALARHERLFGAVWLYRALPSECPSAPTSSCSNTTLPLRAVHGDLGELHTVDRLTNPLRMWAWLFALLTSVFLTSVAVHDHALLEPRCRPGISSIRSLRERRPCWWLAISCVQGAGCMRALQTRSRRLWTALLPFWWIYRLAAFVALVYPITLMACCLQPVRLSRVMVAFTGILCSMCAIAFIVDTAVSGAGRYGLFWNAPQLGQGCVCFCEFPLNEAVVSRLVFLGAVVCLGSFSIGFRALKGLRRANWGNLFSVLYSMPVEAFPVEWERPQEVGGGPIRFRKEGEAVQSEPAFDPFCLMDEQPESGGTCVRLRPAPQAAAQAARWAAARDHPEAEIGCCGFPVPDRSGKVPAQGQGVGAGAKAASEPSAAAGARGVPGIVLPGLTCFDFDSPSAREPVQFEGGARPGITSSDFDNASPGEPTQLEGNVGPGPEQGEARSAPPEPAAPEAPEVVSAL